LSTQWTPEREAVKTLRLSLKQHRANKTPETEKRKGALGFRPVIIIIPAAAIAGYIAFRVLDFFSVIGSLTTRTADHPLRVCTARWREGIKDF
jgi:hypothetical protein